MPPKIDYAAVKQQLTALLSKFREKDNNLKDLVNRLDDKQVKEITDSLIKDIEDKHWASTGANQTIQATIIFKVVEPNG